MQFHGENSLILSASDLTAFSTCEFAFMRQFDRLLGREVLYVKDSSEVAAYAAKLGIAHERKQLAQYKKIYRVAEIASARLEADAAEVLRAKHETEKALTKTATEVIFQATFWQPPKNSDSFTNDDLALGFIGFADFLLRTTDNCWQVQDTKLTNRAKVTALMQLAAYAEQLRLAGYKVAPTAALLHGNNTVSEHKLEDIDLVFMRTRARMHSMLQKSWKGVFQSEKEKGKVGWQIDTEDTRACLKCATCQAELRDTRDSALTAGITRKIRAQLRKENITTITQLARAENAIITHKLKIPDATAKQLQKLSWQASAQIIAAQTGKKQINVYDAKALLTLPRLGAHDIFITFAAEPFYTPTSNKTETAHTGLVFAANLRFANGEEKHFTAHNRSSEKQLLVELMQHVQDTLKKNAAAKIYHFGWQMRSLLKDLTLRHNRFEARVDSLLTGNTLIDLGQLTRRSLILGVNNYDLDTLKTLFSEKPAPVLATDDLLIAGAELANARRVAAATKTDIAAAASELEAKIKSTLSADTSALLQLHNWLHELATAEIDSAAREIAQQINADNDRTRIAAAAQAAANGDNDQWLEQTQFAAELNQLSFEVSDAEIAMALRMLAASYDYHRREAVTDSEEQHRLLNSALEDWGQAKGVLRVDLARSKPLRSWGKHSARSGISRDLLLCGVTDEKISYKKDDSVYLVYDSPAEQAAVKIAASGRWLTNATVLEATADGVMVRENAGRGNPVFDAAPIAVLPRKTIQVQQLRDSLHAWAKSLRQKMGSDPRDAGFDLLRRALPRLTSGEVLDPQSDKALELAGANENMRTVAAIADTVKRLDHSILAVQGPPGAGKTFVSANVIANLVNIHNWRVGVVSQSHAVVENLVTAAVHQGVPTAAALKRAQSGTAATEISEFVFTVPKNVAEIASALQKAKQQNKGLLVGGTAWTFANKLFAENDFDLLVVDEGGQFGMVQALASLRSAKNLLLVGDPQQLPQVSQGVHSLPVDMSALGWLMGADSVISGKRGFFLAHSWRMRPELCTVVSELSYEGSLTAATQAQRATVTDWFLPGLHMHRVVHENNTSDSPEEAQAILALCRRALNTANVVEPDGSKRKLKPTDLIVVAPYNAQVELLKNTLANEGLSSVRVGTVDKFQGQEALLAIISMTCSDTLDTPRGMEFVLSRNRLNVAISRAKWSAHIVHSPRLSAGMPQTATELECLAGFLRLEMHGMETQI